MERSDLDEVIVLSAMHPKYRCSARCTSPAKRNCQSCEEPKHKFGFYLHKSGVVGSWRASYDEGRFHLSQGSFLHSGRETCSTMS